MHRPTVRDTYRAPRFTVVATNVRLPQIVRPVSTPPTPPNPTSKRSLRKARSPRQEPARCVYSNTQVCVHCKSKEVCFCEDKTNSQLPLASPLVVGKPCVTPCVADVCSTTSGVVAYVHRGVPQSTGVVASTCRDYPRTTRVPSQHGGTNAADPFSERKWAGVEFALIAAFAAVVPRVWTNHLGVDSPTGTRGAVLCGNSAAACPVSMAYVFKWANNLPWNDFGRYGYDSETVWCERVYGGRPTSCRAGLTSYTGVVALVALHPRGGHWPADPKARGAAHASPTHASDRGKGNRGCGSVRERVDPFGARIFPRRVTPCDDGSGDDGEEASDEDGCVHGEVRAAVEFSEVYIRT